MCPHPVADRVYHTSQPPEEVFQARLLNNQNGVRIPNGTSSERSWRDMFYDPVLFGTSAIPDVGFFGTTEGAVIHTVTFYLPGYIPIVPSTYILKRVQTLL